MSQKPICGFCISIGINGPHDHWMRVRINNKYTTICPNLKKTKCKKCNCMGHTEKYCTNISDKVEKCNTRKNCIEKDVNTAYIHKLIPTQWELLYLESEDSDNGEEDNMFEERTNKVYEYKRWEDVNISDDEDGELPPLPKSWFE